MKKIYNTVSEYILDLPKERQTVIKKIRGVLKKNLPKGFKEELSYGMIGYVVPHKIFPDGYHCNPKLPLPFINLASQKGFIALYHMAIYSDKKLLKWFEAEYKKLYSKKPDMGKCCIRFKKLDKIPYELIGELAQKYTTNDWVKVYQSAYKKNNK